MRKVAGMGRWNPKAVRNHVLIAGFAKLRAKPIVAVENLADNAFGAGSIYVALFHRRASWEPPLLVNIFLESGKIGGEIFLHEAVTVGAAEVKNIMRIFIDECEVVLHGFADVLV